MQINDLSTEIHHVWQFCWPPVAGVILSVIFFASIVPSFGRWALKSMFGAQDQPDGSQGEEKWVNQVGNRVARVRAMIKPFGLDKLVPLAIVITLVTALIFASGLAHFVADQMPPQLVMKPERLIFQRLSDDESLLLVRRYPLARDCREAIKMALMDWENSKGLRASSFAEYYPGITFGKVAVLICVFGLIAGLVCEDQRKMVLARFFLFVVIAVLIWSFSLWRNVYDHEKSYPRQWDEVRLMLQKAPDIEKTLGKEATKRETSKIRLTKTLPWCEWNWSMPIFENTGWTLIHAFMDESKYDKKQVRLYHLFQTEYPKKTKTAPIEGVKQPADQKDSGGTQK